MQPAPRRAVLEAMRALASVVVLVLAACGARTAPGPVMPAPVAPAPAPEPAPASAPPAPSLWPVPMRVMAWTPDGEVQLGTLPDAPPAAPPQGAWYVEPTRPLDEAMLRRVVAAVRSEAIPGLSLRGQAVGRWLGELRDLPALTALVLDDSDVESVSGLALGLALRRLYLARTRIDDADLAALTGMPLEVLDLEDCAITDRGLSTIVRLSDLRALNLAGTRITDSGGATLGALAKLAVLDLGGTPVGARTLAAIRPLALTELFLDHTHAGKELATLGGFAPGITRFDISGLRGGYRPTDADLAWLARAPHLVEAGLSGTAVHDPLVLAIAAAPRLRELRLAGTPITPAAIQAIAKLDKLEAIDLAETPLDDASAAALLAMPRMRKVRFDRTAITDAAVAVTPSPLLVELFVSNTSVGDGVVGVLEATPKLEALGLAAARLGDATIARIARLSELRTLVLSSARTGRAILGELGALRGIERLYLDGTRLGDDQLARLADLRELVVLHVAGTDLTDAALPVLRGFIQLDELTLGDTRVRGAIADLAAWPRLRTLSLLGLDLGDADLARIARRRTLVTLDLSATEVRDPAPLAGLPHLRTLGLSHLRLSTEGERAARQLAARGVDVVR
jgi:Leucine-rich repeat (LRR) protein